MKKSFFSNCAFNWAAEILQSQRARYEDNKSYDPCEVCGNNSLIDSFHEYIHEFKKNHIPIFAA